MRVRGDPMRARPHDPGSQHQSMGRKRVRPVDPTRSIVAHRRCSERPAHLEHRVEVPHDGAVTLEPGPPQLRIDTAPLAGEVQTAVAGVLDGAPVHLPALEIEAELGHVPAELGRYLVL